MSSPELMSSLEMCPHIQVSFTLAQKAKLRELCLLPSCHFPSASWADPWMRHWLWLCMPLLLQTRLCLALICRAGTRPAPSFARAIHSPIMATKRAAGEASKAKTAKKPKPVEAEEPPVLPFNPDLFNATRARLMTVSNQPAPGTCVVYWMSRDQRASDNHALHYAQCAARESNVPLRVVFNLAPPSLQATLREYTFMTAGLRETEQQLRARDIPLHLLVGDPVANIRDFAVRERAVVVVTDFSPLRVELGWVTGVAAALDAVGDGAVGIKGEGAVRIKGEGAPGASSTASTASTPRIPLVQVDAHNIVPCWAASPHCEYGARTLRLKLQRILPQYLKPIPPMVDNTPGALQGCPPVDWDAALSDLQVDRSVLPADWITPGPAAAWDNLDDFINNRLGNYADKRNDPNENVLSHMSPYLHFGQISAQAMVLRVKGAKKHASGADAFVEESVVRSELADNYCYYNPHYDTLEGCYPWARDSLALHASDPRTHLYSMQQLEGAQTHDDLWNAAQLQMTTEGKMHGFLRMYWAKKILEWTPSPSTALATALTLNDKYNLDGKDPNGYVGCIWSIGGVHDQGWGEREVFGKIRFMNYQGCQRKFDVRRFVDRYPPAAANAVAAGGTVSKSKGKVAPKK